MTSSNSSRRARQMLTSAAVWQIASTPSAARADRGAIAHVAVDEPSGQAAAARRAREYHRYVSLAGERANDRPADIPGATCHEHFHKLTAPAAGTANAPVARIPDDMLLRMFKRQTTGSVVCASCGSLVGVNDDKCYSCGRRNPGLWGFGPMLRAFGNDLGFVALVVYGCSALYVVSLALTVMLGGNIMGSGNPLDDAVAATDASSSCSGRPAPSRCSATAGGGPSSARRGCTAACCTSCSTCSGSGSSARPRPTSTVPAG